MSRDPRTPVIVGIGLSDLPRAPHLDAAQHHALAMQRALRDCGLPKSAIDGYMMSPAMLGDPIDDTPSMAEYLGVRTRFLDGSFSGGSVFELYAQHAAAALREGLCETVLMTYGSDALSRMGRTLGTKSLQDPTAPVRGPLAYETPFGNTLIGSYAMAARRHMHEFGTTSAQLAEIAVAARHNAGFNPNAYYRDPLTVADVLGSRMIADPLHKLDCCVVSDGGGAVIMTTLERARDLRTPPIVVLGAAAATTNWNVSQMPDFTTTAMAVCGPEAFARAGLTPADVDVAQIYDSFTITVLLLLEDLGFCGKGEGGAFVADGRLKLGGALPTNTDGGGLSTCHPGMRGIFLLIEAVRQLRGEAGDAQVPNAQVAVAAGSGGVLSCMGAAVLGTADTL